jgi:hypothetical protein
MTASKRSKVATDGDDAPDSYRETAGWDVPARAASALWLRPLLSRVVRINVAASTLESYLYQYQHQTPLRAHRGSLSHQ